MGLFSVADDDLPCALAEVWPAADSFCECVIAGILGAFQRLYRGLRGRGW